MAKDVVKAIPLTGFDTIGANATAQPINPLGLDEACTILYIVNDSNLDVFISIDGVTLQFYLQAGVTLEIPSQTNSQPQNQRQMFRKGMIVYVQSSTGAAGVGKIYLSGIYSDPN